MKGMFWIAGILLLLATKTTAQTFGGFPPSTKWKQINTDTARVIYGPGAEWQAQRVAALIHKAAADTPFALGKQLHKINVVLHNRTTLANGYVAWGPFISEFYLVPGSDVFDFGTLPWYENLAVHEYRHVQQYNNFRNGLTKGFYYLFGEEGYAFANSITVPDWFFEGDAVHTETALTPQGRGRLANFWSGYNSLWLENRNYSWAKLRNGSLKDYVPDHYRYGYLLTNYGYQKYGDEFWKKVTQDASAFKGLFYPFQRAVKKYSGVDYNTFRKEAFASYQKKLGNAERSMPHEARVSDTYFPQFISDDSLLYLRSAYNKLPSFYVKDGAGEHWLFRQNISSEQWFSYKRGKIAYTSFSTDPRWTLVDYSDVVVADIKNGSTKRLTRKAKYYTPDFSPSGAKIIAVRINDSLKTELQVLNSEDGTVLQTIKSFDEKYFTNPRFIDEERILVGVRTPDAKMSLQTLDLQSGQWEQLTPSSFHTVGQPSVHGDTAYVTANFFGNDDLFAINLQNKNIYRLSGSFTGTYYPSVSNDSLAYSLFTSSGLQLRKTAIKDLPWTPVNPAAFQNQPFRYPVALEQPVITSAGTRKFAEKPYSKSTGLFHFHSWRPDWADPEFTFSLLGTNILNTFSNEIYYRYNQNEMSHAVGWATSYGGFFPVLTAGAEYNANRVLKTVVRGLIVDQAQVYGGYSIPLSFTRGKTYKFLNFGSSYVFSHTKPVGLYKDSLVADNVNYLSHSISWSQYIPKAVQHINPRLGYTAAVNYRHRLGKEASQVLASGQLFLPSVFPNHSLVLSASIQQTDTLNGFFYNVFSVFSNRFVNARGIRRLFFCKGLAHFGQLSFSHCLS
jgi:hypothetical protein